MPRWFGRSSHLADRSVYTRSVKRYDRAYFDRFYRSAEQIGGTTQLRRQVKMVVSITEYLLDHPIQSVLDIGCGEGRWGVEIRRIRHGANYLGLDPSRYVVGELGKRRNIMSGSFESLSDIASRGPFDLVICADVLHYLPARQIDRGLRVLPSLVSGIACLDVTTLEDEPSGDLDGWYRRSAAWYRDRFRRAGLVHCGMQCWVGPEIIERIGAMEMSDFDSSS